MPPRKSTAASPTATTQRRSARQAAATAAATASATPVPAPTASSVSAPPSKKQQTKQEPKKPSVKESQPQTKKQAPARKRGRKPSVASPRVDGRDQGDEEAADQGQPEAKKARKETTPDPDPDSLPAENPDTPRHDGKWYWLLKAEPETRLEGGVDVRFSIDDLRACTKPEGWDGIRSYAARNNLRAMNAGDMAFFYHSNCKTPGIVGTMEIVREQSEDKSARRPGAPYYDPQSTREKPRWSLVHVEFRSKFAVPIYLPELREMGKAGEPLAEMQLLKQSRLSVSRVSGDEWRVLCDLADKKAKDAGLEHEDK